jgi:hypothetical protein
LNDYVRSQLMEAIEEELNESFSEIADKEPEFNEIR